MASRNGSGSGSSSGSGSGIRLGALVVLATLSGCVPGTFMRPPIPTAPGRRTEIGAAGVVVSPPPFTIDPWYGSGQVWVRHRTKPLLTVSAIGGFDLEAAYLGGGLTVDYVQLRRFVGSVDVEGGWGWANVSLPFAVRLFEGGWLYAAPRLGNWGPDPAIFLMAGVDFEVKAGWHLRAESQVNWQDFKAYERRHTIALGLTYQFCASRCATTGM